MKLTAGKLPTEIVGLASAIEKPFLWKFDDLFSTLKNH